MWRLVDIATDHRMLSLSDNALVISDDKAEIARIFMADIGAVVIHSYHAMLSKNVIVALADHGIPLVYCDKSHMPTAMSLPATAHYRQAERAAWQAEAGLPVKKQLWKQIVRCKIREQARTLTSIDDITAASLLKLARDVQSGDKGNVEAIAARLYWPSLMGKDFRRDRSGDHVNPALNYGYTILRSAIARAVVAAGLNPSLGLFHKNKLNNFCLVDDLLEPFRPLVDRLVYEKRSEWQGKLEKEPKMVLAEIINRGIAMEGGVTVLTQLFFILCNSLIDVFAGKSSTLVLPEKVEFSEQYALGV